MTDLDKEWDYVYHERIGLLDVVGAPTVEQKQLAIADADRAVEQMKEGVKRYE